jgi:hypothetical protein
MVFVLGALYCLFALAIGSLVWRQERRKDLNAEILGLSPGRSTVGLAGLVLSSALLAVVPTVIAWAVLRPIMS